MCGQASPPSSWLVDLEQDWRSQGVCCTDMWQDVTIISPIQIIPQFQQKLKLIVHVCLSYRIQTYLDQSFCLGLGPQAWHPIMKRWSLTSIFLGFWQWLFGGHKIPLCNWDLASIYKRSSSGSGPVKIRLRNREYNTRSRKILFLQNEWTFYGI